jgi:hypothetical protein
MTWGLFAASRTRCSHRLASTGQPSRRAMPNRPVDRVLVTVLSSEPRRGALTARVRSVGRVSQLVTWTMIYVIHVYHDLVIREIQRRGSLTIRITLSIGSLVVSLVISRRMFSCSWPELAIKLAIRFFSLGEITELDGFLLHRKIIPPRRRLAQHRALARFRGGGRNRR